MSEPLFWRWIGCGTLAVLLAAAAPDQLAVADEDAPAVAELPAPDASEIPLLITRLDSSDFRLRREATRKLASAGTLAVEPLTVAARTGSLEAKVRAVAVLEEIYTTAGDEAVDAAEMALEHLATSEERSLSGRADQVLARHYEVRERRAVAAIQKLGGVVEYADASDPNLRVVNPNGLDSAKPPIRFVRLGTGWKGGDQGLIHFQRLRPASFVQGAPVLYLIDGSGVTKEGLENLQAAVPQLILQNRGRAFLGVQGATDPNGRGCHVAMVEPGSSADKGNIQPQDVIISFNEKPSPTFESLIELIGATRPGDKVKVEVLRGFQTVSLEVEMSGWRK